MGRNTKIETGHVFKVDEQIKKNIIDTLYFDEGINSSKVAVKVKDGIVTLTGSVLKEKERLSAGMVAKTAPGVSKVNNFIAIVDTPPGNPLSRVA